MSLFGKDWRPHQAAQHGVYDFLNIPSQLFSLIVADFAVWQLRILTNISFSVTTTSLRGVDLVEEPVIGGLMGCLLQASRAHPPLPSPIPSGNISLVCSAGLTVASSLL